MNIAIIGASGFIGKNLVTYLSKKSYNIIPVYFNNPIDHPNAISYNEFINANRKNKITKKIESIVFSGGSSNHNIENNDLFNAIKKDSLYIQNITETFEIRKAILISSAAVYYGYEGPVDENTCPKPNVNYGISKRIGEMIFEKEVDKNHLQGIVLRLTHAFGKYEREKRLFRNIAKAIINGTPIKINGKGESYINPVSVDFLCNVVEYFLFNKLENKTEYYNVGSEKEITVKEIVEKLQKIFDFEYTFSGEEKQPVRFITNVKKLSKLGITFHNVIENVANYIQSIIEESI
jgi:nucleoside-diphosphate-sugar epimerase